MRTSACADMSRPYIRYTTGECSGELLGSKLPGGDCQAISLDVKGVTELD